MIAGPMGAGRTSVLMVSLGILAACGGDDVVRDEDHGPIDEILEPADRFAWPGVDFGFGRQVPRYHGFGGGRPIARWIFGMAPRATADSFWFCREGDDACPLDANRRLSWDRIIGRPVFARLPGEVGYSPFWRIWKVTVDADFEEDTAKSVATVRRLEDDGVAQVERLVVDFGEVFGEEVGSREALAHCPLVLTGTALEGNGEVMADGETRTLTIQSRLGWFEGYRVELMDFSVSDGVLAPADDGVDGPLLRFATLYTLRRVCDGPSEAGVCALGVGDDEVPVDEGALCIDITGDGDRNDTNNVAGGLPCEESAFRDSPGRPDEPVYSPLRAIYTVEAPASSPSELGLIDTYGDQAESDIRSVADVFAAVDDGSLREPRLWPPDQSDAPPADDDPVRVFAEMPVAVPEGWIPFPCAARD